MNDVQAFSFSRKETPAPVMLSGVDRLGEKLGRQLRGIFESYVGVRAQVETRKTELTDYGRWSADVPKFCSINVYRLLPLKGNVLLRVDAPLVSLLVDRFYGGSGDRIVASRAEFTPTEERLITRLTDAITTKLVACWGETLPLEPQLVAREAGLGFAASGNASDQLVVQRYDFSLGGDECWPVELVYPLTALRSVEPLMTGKVHDEAAGGDPLWQARVARRMEDIRLPVRTVLARPNLTLAELQSLQVGDVIPININRSLPLIVGDRIVAHGNIGEQDGRAAFMIENLK